LEVREFFFSIPLREARQRQNSFKAKFHSK
jgi:hypothetical protein